MKTKDQKMSGKSTISAVLYAAAIIVALIGIALLITNITQYSTILKQYIAQGYPAADVIRQLLPNQLLPGIFQAVGMYGGIAFVLLGVGIANKKASRCLTMLANAEACNDAVEENTLEQDVEAVENTETMETPEGTEENKNA